MTSSSLRKPSFTRAEPRRQLRFLLDLGRLLQLLWGNDLLFDEKITQPLRHTSISYPTTAEKCRCLRVVHANRGSFSGENRSVFALT